MTSVMSNQREELKSLRQLKDDTAKLHNIISLQNQQIITAKKQAADNWNDYKTLKTSTDQVITNQDEVIRMKDKTIETLNKRKVSVFRQVMQVLAGVGVGVLVGLFK